MAAASHRQYAFFLRESLSANIAEGKTGMGRYSPMIAVSDNIYGPYRMRHEAVPCGGGTIINKLLPP